MTKKLLAVFSHPDDETLAVGGTLHSLTQVGVQVFLLCHTKGQRGMFRGERDAYSTEQMASIRQQELYNAGKVLGVSRIHVLDYMDGMLSKEPLSPLVEEITQHIRDIQPQVLVTFEQNGITGHPDHRFTSEAVIRAYEQCKHEYPFLALYLVAVPDNLRQLVDIYQRTESLKTGVAKTDITTRIDIRASLPQKKEASMQHASQEHVITRYWQRWKAITDEAKYYEHFIRYDTKEIAEQFDFGGEERK